MTLPTTEQYSDLERRLSEAEARADALAVQLERANRLIGWMMPYIGSMCPPQNGLAELNDHCFENSVRPRMDDETKGPSIRQHATRPSGVTRAAMQGGKPNDGL